MAGVKVGAVTLSFQTGTSLTAYSTWTFTGTNATRVQEYKVIWEYDTGNGIWFVGNDGSTNYKQSTYSVPSNARYVRLRIRPISKTYKDGKTEKSYFTGAWSANKKIAVPAWFYDRPIPAPSAPSVAISNKSLIAELDNISTEQGPTKVQFQFIKNNSTKKGDYTNKDATIATRHAAAQISVVAGASYKVRARCWKVVNKKNIYSDWSDYSESISAPELQAPSSPPSIEANATKVKMSLNVYNEPNVDYVDFDLLENNTSIDFDTSKTGKQPKRVKVSKNVATFTYDGTYNKRYKVRARFYSSKMADRVGDYSDYSEEVTVSREAVQVPNTPTVSIKNGKLTASLTIYYTATVSTNRPNQICFEAVANNKGNTKTNVNKMDWLRSSIATNYATVSWPITPGFEYKVRARGEIGSGARVDRYSSWSEWSSAVYTGPSNIDGAPVATADSETSVKVTWSAATNAQSYEVQYTDMQKYFDTSPDNVKSMTVEGVTTAIITGLDTGKLWYFRVRAVNDQGTSNWTKPPVSCRIGTIPTAPTTWSYTSTATIGQDVILNWVHNDEDGSEQSEATVRLTINGTTSDIPVSGTTSSYRIKTGGYIDGTIIYWQVRTKGAMSTPNGGFGPWSTKRQVTIYAPATVNVNLYTNSNWLWDPFEFATDTIYTAKGEGYEDLVDGILYHFPFYATIEAFPTTQKIVSMTVSIVARESYDTFDDLGYTRHIQQGTEVYKKYFTDVPNNKLDLCFSAGDVTLESNMTYDLKVAVAMSSGLSGEGSAEFTVAWDSDFVEPDANISINFDTYSAYIHPFCDNGFSDALLSVYRREYDGTFTPIAVNLDADDDTTIVDPHPALDFARYRVTALSKINGLVSYYDVPAEEIGCSSIIIQWDEAWTPFDVYDFGMPEAPPYSGSMLVLPYNVDVQNDVKRDVALVEYIGRQSPVSYYGTQKGETAQWSSDIPADDFETLYQIRKLAAYSGDVYVREPSGTGYWANVIVSYKLEHTKTVVPVSISITRVDGGM